MPFDLPHLFRSVDVFQARESPGGVVLPEWKSSIPYANAFLSHDISRTLGTPVVATDLGIWKATTWERVNRPT